MENYRIDCEVKYEGEQDCTNIRAFELAPELIQECVNEKNYQPIISYLESLKQSHIEEFIPSTTLEKAVMESCNIYEANVEIKGYVVLDNPEDDFDPGVLTDVNYKFDEDNSECGCYVTGCYTFEVAAKSEADAYKQAQDVFDEHWDNGYVDCGDIENTDTSEDRIGGKFEVVDSYTFAKDEQHHKKEVKEYGDD